MTALVDPDALYAIARRISLHAESIRATADRLGTQLGSTRWSGAAADSFHVEAARVVAALRFAATQLDDSAAALRTHAHAVSQALQLIAAIGHDLAAVGHAVQDGVSEVGHGVVEGLHLVGL